MTLLPKIAPRDDVQREAKRRAELERSLIRREAQIGGQLFGPVPTGHDRQFFCLDEHTWVWHESWLDAKKQRRSVTTRYEIHPNGILKLQDGQTYQRLSSEEARNLNRVTKIYRQRVMADYQAMLRQPA